MVNCRALHIETGPSNGSNVHCLFLFFKNDSFYCLFFRNMDVFFVAELSVPIPCLSEIIHCYSLSVWRHVYVEHLTFVFIMGCACVHVQVYFFISIPSGPYGHIQVRTSLYVSYSESRPTHTSRWNP